MARQGSTTTTRRSRAKAAPDTETTTEATEAEVTTEAQEGDSMSTETVEPEATEAQVSDTTATETDATATTEVSDEAKAKEAAAEQGYTDFRAAVTTALAERDPSTGVLPEVQLEAVKAAFRGLAGAKYKGRAKRSLNDDLKNAVNEQDLILGTAVMALADAVENAGPVRASGGASSEPRKAVDPAQAYREGIVVLHLAYALARDNTPEGVDAEAESDAINAKVNELNDAARSYFTWLTSTAEDKGDEPEVDVLIKRAAKAATGKAAGRTRSAAGASAPRAEGAPRRNVRTHIAQVFDKLGKGSGEMLKISEIANTATDEYPSADCSPGAISAALKSAKGVEGFELAEDENGHAAARKL